MANKLAHLRPPRHPTPLGAGDTCPWVLLDQCAYIAKDQNHTTASSDTRDRGKILVTFFFAHPPRVSNFCVHCPGSEPTEFALPPTIVATEGNLAVLRVVLGPLSNIWMRSAYDYYVYEIDGAPNGGPLLTRLPLLHPELFDHHIRSRLYYFRDDEIGVLRRDHTNSDDDGGLFLRPHGTIRGHDGYIVAALATRETKPEQFDLFTFDSKTRAWSSRQALLDQKKQRRDFKHVCSKVITIGGEAGTMGWVDLWRGILFCDVLQESPSSILHYLPLPQLPEDKELMANHAMKHRDIAIIGNRIKYVQLQIHIRPGSYNRGFYISDGWTATTWSTTTTNPWEVGWRKDCKVHSSKIFVSPVHCDMLPKLRDEQCTPRPILSRLHVGQPTLSLQDDDIVYFMTKVDQRKKDKAWVIAVDMRDKALKGVTEFDARRIVGLSFTYMHSSLSQYQNPTPGTKGHLKRPGMLSLGSSHKKLPRIPMMDYVSTLKQYGHGEQKLQDAEVAGASVGGEYGDNMDLE